MNPSLPLFLLAALALAISPNATADVEVRIGVIQAQLRYDKTSFNAKPGEKVTLTFENTDELAHNLIVCRGGEDAWKPVAEAALKLGDKGNDKGWLPESDLILVATRMLAPHEKQTLAFTAPDTEGIYPYVCTFPGHALLMRGQIVVSKFPRGLGDLRFRYYEGNWSNLPDFANLEPAAVGKIEDNKITLAPRKRDDNFGFVFEGDLQAPVEGEYLFSTSSDDGSRLLVDGKVVVNNDGSHPVQQASGKTRLTQGSHRLEVQYFEGAVDQELNVAWSGPGFKMESLSTGGPLGFTDPTEFQPIVFGGAKVIRVLLPGASSRSMAVGLPGGVNFCFDADTCSVRYAWDGGFVDVSPERGNGTGRGGGVCRPLGQTWKVGDTASPTIRFGESDPKPRFSGYRIDGDAVEFLYQIGDRAIKQKVSAFPTGEGLQYRFNIGGNGPKPQITINRDEAEVTGDNAELTIKKKG